MTRIKDERHQWSGKSRLGGCLWSLPMSGDSPEVSCVGTWLVKTRGYAARRLVPGRRGVGGERGCVC